MTHNHAEYPVEDPVESPAAQAMIHDIVQTSRNKDLRKLGGSHLARLLVSKQITRDEHLILRDELEARRKSLTMPADVEPPMDPLADTAVPEEPWSPSDILATLKPHEFDARERAAGEHLDR